MKISAITGVFALLATGAVARNCTPGLVYCGFTLKAIGKYTDQIAQELHDTGHGTLNGDNVLFYCEGGNNGLIKFIANCSTGCHQNGKGVNDVCNVIP